MRNRSQPASSKPRHDPRQEDAEDPLWPRIVDLFNELVDLPPQEREVRLDQHDLDPAVCAEVRSLLASDDRGSGSLDHPAARLGALAGSSEDESDPAQVGPYRILRRIGTGGMGVILLAERADGQFAKRVAVKLLKRGMDSEHIVERFRSERQILASLEHPAIARLLDGGIAEDGRPYFVLEHVEGGTPIDRYCRQSALSLEQRLRLFLDVCAAVQSAHWKLVLHRDLKPSNLLVSDRGEVKLLDFGIAKLLTPQPDSSGATATRTQHRLLTPGYASPEQERGDELSTASDVYSLGVVLFELLTGTRPTQTSGESGDRVARRELQTPSRALTSGGRKSGETWQSHDPKEVAAAVRGDLDTVVLHCLHHEPKERYHSVEALGEDIQRFLDGRPVLARPQTFWYRARKLIGRHRLAAAAICVATVAVFAGVAGTISQAQRARTERDRATAEAAKATQVSRALEDLFALSNPSQSVDAQELRLRDLVEQAETSLTGRLQDHPEVLAKMQSILGKINTDRARYEVAESQLTSSVETLRRLFPDGHPDLAEALERLSGVKSLRGEHQEAFALAAEALDLARRDGVSELQLSNALLRYGATQQQLRSRDAAEEAYREALAIRERLLGPEDPRVARCLGLLGVIEYARGDYQGAAGLVRRAVEINRRAFGPVHQQVAHELNNLGAILAAAGDRAGALEAHAETLEVRRAVFGPDHPYVAFSLQHLGELSEIEGDFATAEERLRAALEIREGAHGREHDLVGATLTTLGRVLGGAGRLAEAENLLREAHSIQQRISGAEHRRTAVAAFELGRHLLSAGQLEESEALLRGAAASHEARLGAEHDLTAAARVAQARALFALGRLEEASVLNSAAVASLEASFPEGHLRLAPGYLLAADIEHGRGDRAAARRGYTAHLELLTRELGSAHPRVVEARGRLDEVQAAEDG